MLIPTHRLKPGDQEHWNTLERYDHTLAKSTTLHTKTQKALDTITTRWNTGPRTEICSVSWGKDSTIIAHLIAETNLPIPIVWVRSDPFEMPECETVRDTFLHQYPHVRYEERTARLWNPKRGQPGYEQHHTDPTRPSQNVLKQYITEPYISGVRAEESRIRQQSARWHGTTTKNTIRPILHWTATEVFAYLHLHNLPIHPAYAMTYGGKLDRRWIRVHPLCSHKEESAIHGRDSASWEDDYYADAIRHALNTALPPLKPIQ